MKNKMLFAVPFAFLMSIWLHSCISEEIRTDKYSTRPSLYNSANGPFKNILILCRDESTDLNRLKKFEHGLKAKGEAHGTNISFLTYKTEDSAFLARLNVVKRSKKIELIIRLSHSGQFMRKAVQDPFPGMNLKNSFRVERLSFTMTGYESNDPARAIWKSNCSVVNTSIPAADEEAVTCLYNRLLKDGIML
jgi:hypothetical protein